jgi:hypothetical protein
MDMKRRTLPLAAGLLLLSVCLSCRKADSPTLPDPSAPTPTGCSIGAVPVAINAAGVTFNGNTSGATNDFEGASCQAGTGAKDDLYSFTLSATTRVEFLKSSTWTSRFYIRQGACLGTEVACLAPNGLHQVNLAAGTYYLIVDGDLSTDNGAYQLSFKDVTP